MTRVWNWLHSLGHLPRWFAYLMVGWGILAGYMGATWLERETAARKLDEVAQNVAYFVDEAHYFGWYLSCRMFMESSYPIGATQSIGFCQDLVRDAREVNIRAHPSGVYWSVGYEPAERTTP